MVRIKDIALKCGVSIATVSKALNHSSEISVKTTEKIIKVANDMGYIANSNARSLKTNRSYNLGILFVDPTKSGLTHEYFSTILNSIKDHAEQLGYDVTFISDKIGGTKKSYLTHARYRACDGVIVVTADFSDNISGLDEIVRHVVGLGHKKIAYIHGEDTTVTQQRLASFYKTCAALGVQVPKTYVKKALYHIPKNSGLATRELLNLEDRPTCIIYPDDYSYMGGLSEIEKHGLKIPQDISVVGYDGIYLSKILRPMLTTYVQNSEEIGRLSVSELIKMIEKPLTYIPRQIIVKGELRPGQTVKQL